MVVVNVPNGHTWCRLADPAWADPLDATHAANHGGRWTPRGGPPTLYLNADGATARANVVRFLADAPFAPEDLNETNGYQLVDVGLPDDQRALDAVSDDGLTDIGLPTTYPLDAAGAEIGHATCQPIGAKAHADGLDGVSDRSASRVGRELAWWPRGRRATTGAARPFSDWYYAGP